jgi:hypothetical protein
MFLLVLFNILLLLSLLCHMIQISILLYLVYRLVQDKNAAVGFVKSVWTQLQEEVVQHFFVEKKEELINK